MTCAYLYDIIKTFSDQQSAIAVQEALRVASEKATAYGHVGQKSKRITPGFVNKQSIISIYPQIIKNLKK